MKSAPYISMFRKTVITIEGKATQGYAVEGLDPQIYRGLQVVLVKDWGWSAYEATTGLSMMPGSWAGGFSNKTRQGALQILANRLSDLPQETWDHVQKGLDYELNKEQR